MRKLKIVVLTESIATNSGSRAPFEIAKNLSRLGNSVSVYAFDVERDLTAESELKKNGVKVVVFEKSRTLNFIKFLPNFEIVKTLKKDKPDFIVLAAFLPSLLAAKIARFPVVRIYMGTQFNAYLERKSLVESITPVDHFFNIIGNIYIYFIEFATNYLSNYIVAISKFCQKEVKKMYFKKVDRVIYLGGNHLPKVATKNSLPKNYFNLLTVSRITPYKNFHLLIEGIKKIKTRKKIFLTIVGKPEKPKYLKYLKKISTKNIKILPNLTDSQLSNLYKKCDLYVTADRNLFFGFPITEAAFFAKPALAFNFAAAKEIIEPGKTGFLVKNQKQFGEVLKKSISNPQLLKIFGKNAQNRANKMFKWQKIANEYNKFFPEILEKNHAELQ